jgi:hypothetical protein
VGTNEEHFENKDSGEDAEPNIARDKLREELQIMWYKVRLLQMYERQRLSKLIENNKLIHLKKEISKWNRILDPLILKARKLRLFRF